MLWKVCNVCIRWVGACVLENRDRYNEAINDYLTSCKDKSCSYETELLHSCFHYNYLSYFTARLLVKCMQPNSICPFLYFTSTGSLCMQKMTNMTHPFSVQEHMDFKDHAVIHHNLLISVKDLKYPAEHGAIVNPCRAEAAFSWEGTTEQQYKLSVTVVSLTLLYKYECWSDKHKSASNVHWLIPMTNITRIKNKCLNLTKNCLYVKNNNVLKCRICNMSWIHDLTFAYIRWDLGAIRSVHMYECYNSGSCFQLTVLSLHSEVSC